VTTPALRFEGFGLAFVRGGQRYPLFEEVDLEVPMGGLYLVVGESGSGKSTLLRLVAGLWDERANLPVVRGRLQVLGASVTALRYPRALRGPVQAVQQDEGLLDELSPRENVALGLRAANRSPRLAPALLARAGLDDPPADVASLSGGMRKRVAVARALAGEPRLLVFDEPTAGLDGESARQIAALIAGTQRQSGRERTTLVITHDPESFTDLADGILRLDPERRSLSFARDRDPAHDGDSGSSPEDFALEDPAVAGVRKLVLAFSAVGHTLLLALVRLPPVYPMLAARTTARYVIEAVFFVVVGCGTVGGLATFFALRNNPLEGAFTTAVITGAGKVLVAVLVPLLAGFFFTARIAAGVAARLGTMKRTSQVDALRLLGIRPADYLLTPAVWGTSLAMPLTAFAGIVMATLASLIATSLVTGSGGHGWAIAYFAELELRDLRFALGKTVLSGFLVAVATYHLAMGPKRSGADVGRAVNSSIVVGIFLVLLVHAVLTLVQFG
jgi:ABC-type transporter Mla maintaining outer membrane lipid asymmetry ATPase subunit MlaF/ABC-type transporter Mla maintaining outer membrane lipid asymmetry permease subunit MlaE